MKNILLLTFIAFFLNGYSQTSDKLKFIPIGHASLIIEYNGMNIYIDPAGDYSKYKDQKAPDIIFITHTHGDHLNPELLSVLKTDKTTIFGNKKAIETLGYGYTIMNGEKKEYKGLKIEAVAMYNTSPDRLRYHPQGEGNGYVITCGNERIYVSGDTEDTYEVRHLKNIDHAFLCMNLPFTMTPEQAASAVFAFKPKKVYPYHYSQRDGFADIEKFKKIVNEKCDSEVIFLKWYDTDQ